MAKKNLQCRKINRVEFCKDTEDAYTDIGKDGEIWRGYDRGFEITVYPVSLYNRRMEGWEYALYNEKKEVDWNSLFETSVDGDHAKDAEQAMRWANTTVKEWE